MRVGQLNSQRRTVAVTVEVDGASENLTVVYRPQAYTPALAARVREMVSDPMGNAEALVAQLTAVLESWDLQGDDGTPYPTTAEALSALPSQFLSSVATGIGEDLTVGKQTSATSDAT